MIDLWGSATQNTIVDQQRSELYMRIFQYASEDFANNQDMQTFANDIVQWASSVENRMKKLEAELNTHTHQVPAHTHQVPPHTHLIMPHTHPTSIGPSGPNIPTPTDTGTLAVTGTNATFDTLKPTKELKWQEGQIPKLYQNTSGAITNLNNKLSASSGIIGDPIVHPRRSVPLPKSVAPNIPPYLLPIPV